MEFYMVCHYFYDGEGRRDLDYVMPCSTKKKAMKYLSKVIADNHDYDWAIVTKDKVAWRDGPGRYGYDYYYIDKLTMDEEI